MQPLNNSLILNYDANPSSSLVGAATFVHDPVGETLTVTDASTVTAPDTFAILHCDVFDKFGKRVYGKIEVALGNVVIDVSTLNPSRGFAVSITVVTTKGQAKDGSAFKIANSQTTGGFDVEK